MDGEPGHWIKFRKRGDRMAFQRPPGTQDILPGSTALWQHVEQTARELCRRYHYREIRTPIFEATELFQRGVGETTDIVEEVNRRNREHRSYRDGSL